MSILKYIFNKIMFILSYSPIICLSDDNQFGTNTNGIEHFFNRIRFSLLSFNYGKYILYFISFKKGEGVKIVHLLNLEDYYKFSESDKNRVSNNQDVYLSQNSNTEVDKEFLNYLYENENNRKNTSYNKINTYTTIILAIIPLILLFFKKEMFLNASLVMKILIGILLYILLNITVFILQSNKVKGNERARYSEIKTSSNKSRAMIKAYYMDWQNIKRESDMIVSFVANIEVYIKGAIIVSVLIAILNVTGVANLFQKNVIYDSINETSINEISLNELNESDKKTLKKLNSINENITEKKISKIIILYNDEKILENKSFNAICDYYNIYNKKVNKVYDKYATTKDDKIKILLVEG